MAAHYLHNLCTQYSDMKILITSNYTKTIEELKENQRYDLSRTVWNDSFHELQSVFADSILYKGMKIMTERNTAN